MINYRIAQPGDEISINRLIVELAVFEREPSAVIVSPTSLYNHLFVEKICFAIVAEDLQTNAIIGFALYYFSYSTWKGKCLYLEDLYVEPEYRGRGYGLALLKHLAKICVERGYGRFQWWVLDWNTPSIEFYKSQGAVPMDEWTVFRVSDDALNKLGS